MKHFVYIVKCRDDSLYTGFTRNPTRRVIEHNTSKKGAKSIRGKLPAELVYFEEYNTKSEALKREAEIKSWSRVKKLGLINKKPKK